MSLDALELPVADWKDWLDDRARGRQPRGSVALAAHRLVGEADAGSAGTASFATWRAGFSASSSQSCQTRADPVSEMGTIRIASNRPIWAHTPTVASARGAPSDRSVRSKPDSGPRRCT